MKKALILGITLFASGLFLASCGSGEAADAAEEQKEISRQDSLQNELQKSSENLKAKEAELKKAMEELEALRNSDGK